MASELIAQPRRDHNVYMRWSHPGLVTLTALVGLGLAACEGDKARFEPEVLHCATVAGLATNSYGDIIVTRAHHWVLDNVRSVQLNFDYPPDAEFKRGNIVCMYDFDLSIRADPERVVKAKNVYFKGRYFSVGELKFVNTSMFRPTPEFKVIP